MFGAQDTTFRSAASWGARASQFNPHVPARVPVPVNEDRGPGCHAAMGGARAHPTQISVPAKDKFVAGGWSRNKALEHLELGADGRVVCEGGVLGETFNEYLRTLPGEELTKLHREYADGIDAWQHVEASAREEIRPSDAAALQARKHRKISKAEVWNSTTVADNLEVRTLNQWTREQVACANACPLNRTMRRMPVKRSPRPSPVGLCRCSALSRTWKLEGWCLYTSARSRSRRLRLGSALINAS